MGYKTIRTVSNITRFLAVVYIFVNLIRIVIGDWSARDMMLPVGLAFLFMSMLASTVVSILEAQSDEIAQLRRQLTESRAGS